MSIIPSEAVLTESRTARQQYGTRIDVLEKVRAIPLLPDDLHVTTEGVAAFFDVGTKTIESLVLDNRDELETNGYRVISGRELTSFKEACGITSRARALALFDRRTLLNVAMLLTQSEIARQVRRHLLDSEQAVRDLEAQALARRAAGGPLSWTWFETCAIIRQHDGPHPSGGGRAVLSEKRQQLNGEHQGHGDAYRVTSATLHVTSPDISETPCAVSFDA